MSHPKVNQIFFEVKIYNCKSFLWNTIINCDWNHLNNNFNDEFLKADEYLSQNFMMLHNFSSELLNHKFLFIK